ncbi:MAG: Glycosyl transferase group 1 [Parcubacteria group bacterium GW2011_GWA2_47_26]|nr:MAG: Glycosyl transferase group 1 [Parcubacteria group bacterium GW2011_GWA2_47_26]
MKIAYLTCVYPPYPGGIGVAAAGMAKEMASRRGYAVEVFTPRYRRELGIRNQESGVEMHYLKPLLSYGKAAILPQLLWRLRRFDIVHVYYPFFGGAEVAVLARKLWKFKLILHHEMDVVGEGEKRDVPLFASKRGTSLFFTWHTRKILPWIIKNTDCVCVLSDDYFMNSDFGRLYKKMGERFPTWRVVPNGVDVELFRPTNFCHPEPTHQSESLVRGRLREGSRDSPSAVGGRRMTELPTILLVAGLDRAHYFKGVHVLIEALRILKKRGVNFMCKIIGDGDMRKVYEEQAKQVGLKNRDVSNFAAQNLETSPFSIVFVGLVPHDELPVHYRNATVLVVPSTGRIESFSIVAAEAQACGLPAIVSDLPGVRVTIEDGVTGLKVKPGDPEDLANQLEILLMQKDLTRKMGEAGRKRAEEFYSWTGIGNKMEEIYKKV